MSANDDILVKVEGLSKKFCKDFKTGLWYGVKDLTSNLFGKTAAKHLRPKEFWALQDINFELRRGECLGLIGHNGAGKSTLLKILNGLIMPDSGRVIIKGRVGALIELGAGFNPVLSGRENIYNNGAVLGFTRREINSKLQAIIDFAELEEFIDMPVQHYSSGMRVRLGFAVAAQMEPDVLIIDEVLAVGDVGFRAKCYERISELQRHCVVILVSHSMPQVSKICSSGLLLNSGKETYNGEIGKAIENYYEQAHLNFKDRILISNEISNVHLVPSQNNLLNFSSPLDLKLEFTSKSNLTDVEVNLVFLSRELIPVSQLSTRIMKNNVSVKKGSNKIKFSIKNINLNTGVYSISLTIDDNRHGQKYFWGHNLTLIKVFGEEVGISPVQIMGEIQIEH